MSTQLRGAGMVTLVQNPGGSILIPPDERVPARAMTRRPAIVNVDDLPGAWAAGGNISPMLTRFLDGEKYPGGFGPTHLYLVDYWTLRKRSIQMFSDNLYARGLIRRLITNEINTGLTLEATPESDLVGLSEDEFDTWTEDVEIKFNIWAEDPNLCDYYGEHTLYELQEILRLNSLVAGDMLVVIHQSKVTGLPMIQLIDGEHVQNSLNTKPKQGNKIKWGVEFDSKNRKVAFHVRQEDNTVERVPAYGERTGRRRAWLVYGTDKLCQDVRGQPLLGIVLQSLREMDRNRDAEQRAALINSILAMSVKKTEPKMGTHPIPGGAGRRDEVHENSAAGTRSFNISSLMPGLIVEELQEGEELVAHEANRPNVNFGAFETAVLSAIAWANEIPPEVLLLQFGNNYSASRGAVNEFKLYLNRIRARISTAFCKPIYEDWILSEVLNGNVVANGFLEAWRGSVYNIYRGWISSDWGGAIKPAVDMEKEVDAYGGMTARCWVTNDRASKELTGTKFSRNARRMKRENQQIAEAVAPLLEMEAKFPGAMENLGMKRITKPTPPASNEDEPPARTAPPGRG